jgi:hypothetical protein
MIINLPPTDLEGLDFIPTPKEVRHMRLMTAASRAEARAQVMGRMEKRDREATIRDAIEMILLSL